MKRKKLSLQQYLQSLQVRGQYTFTREEALSVLGCTQDAFRFAALRLIKKKRLARPTRGFYVIVPTEYSVVGIPPVTWFVDALMKYFQQPYYVCLLSAAALYGAAHQQPQLFQVMTNKPLRAIKCGQFCIQFYTKKHILPLCYQSMKTFTGYMNVSIPEVTAIDLVHYIKPAGHLNNIATVLNELQEKLDKDKLIEVLEKMDWELPDIQRLGYLLDLVGASQELISVLKNYLGRCKTRLVSLRSDKSSYRVGQNQNWRLYVNEKIEIDYDT